MRSLISAGSWRSRAITATPRSRRGRALREGGQRLEPIGARVVVGPHRGVAELLAAGRQRGRDLRVEPRRDAESAVGHRSQDRDALDVRRVREHVHRRHLAEPIAGLGELSCVRRQRCRVAGDVDDSRRAALDHAAHDLLRQPRARGVDDHHVGLAGLLEQRPHAESHVPAMKRALPIPFALRVVLGVGDRLGDVSTPHTSPALLGEGEADRPDAAVEVEDALACRAARRTRRRSRRAARPSRCWSGRRRRGRSRSRSPPSSSSRNSSPEDAPVGPAVPPLGPSTTVCEVDRRLGAKLAGAGDQPSLQLAGAPPLADDEIAQDARAGRGGRRRRCPRRAPSRGPRCGPRCWRSSASRQSSASITLASCPRRWKPSTELAVALAERVLELVAVAPLLDRRARSAPARTRRARRAGAAPRRPARLLVRAGARSGSPCQGAPGHGSPSWSQRSGRGPGSGSSISTALRLARSRAWPS